MKYEEKRKYLLTNYNKAMMKGAQKNMDLLTCVFDNGKISIIKCGSHFWISVWEVFSYGTADFYQREHFIMVAVFCEKHSYWSGESEDARYHPKK